MLIHPSPSSTRVRRVAATLFATALLAACGTSGGDDVTSDSTAVTTTTAQGTADTTEPGTDETTTTETGTGSGGEVSVDDLEAILPTADDLGGDYQEVADDDSDEANPAEAAILDACPGAEEFVSDDDAATASRSFQAEDGRSMSVELNPTPKHIDEDSLDDFVDVLNGCDEIAFSADGYDYTVVITAERYDELGDRGVTMVQEITIDHEELSAPIEFEQGILQFLHGSVGVEIIASDGVDAEGSVTPADYEVVGQLGSRISRDLEDLLGA